MTPRNGKLELRPVGSEILNGFYIAYGEGGFASVVQVSSYPLGQEATFPGCNMTYDIRLFENSGYKLRAYIGSEKDLLKAVTSDDT